MSITTTLPPSRTVIPWRVVGIWALLLPGVIALQPAFGGVRGFLPGLAGITVGAALMWAAHRWRWSIGVLFLAVLGSYLVVGNPLAVPREAYFGFLPSLESTRRLVLLTFQSWRDLLTVATPAGDLSGPGAAPLLAGLVAGLAGAAIGVKSRAVLWPMALPILWLAANIAFGVREAPTATWLGVALGMGLLVWALAHRLTRQANANAQVFLSAASANVRAVRDVVVAGAVILLAAAVGVAAAVASSDRINRQVLRDDIAPPLNLTQYPSPLTSYRLFELDLKDEVLFTVTGMPAQTRLRLAVMDTYDGNVFNVSQHTGHYLRTGRTIPPVESAQQASISVLGEAYADVWVPSFGHPTRVEFDGPREPQLADGLYYNRSAAQALSTAALGQGDGYTLIANFTPELTASQRQELAELGAGSAPLADVTRVPDIIVKNAADWTADATSAYAQMDTLATRLREDGFYSDGSDGKSRSGHTAERLSTMLTSSQIIGDDEQYATSLALMGNQLGIPTRVVMGFYPPGDQEAPAQWDVTGTQAHVWVEANLDGAGWVSFDATPDRDKQPQTDTPQPKPQPKPQVDPPPNPPERLPDEPVVADEEATRREEDIEPPDLTALWVALGIVGAGALGAAPFLGILLLKRRRTRRRRTGGSSTDQIAGAWDDLVDKARDLGHVAATSLTRQESASILAQQYPQAEVGSFARRVDARVFSSEDATDDDVEATWERAENLKQGLARHVAWYRRPAATFSLRSFGRRRVAPPPPPKAATIAKDSV